MIRERVIRNAAAIFVFLCASFLGVAQESVTTESHEISVHFRVSSHEVERSYLGNGEALDSLASIIKGGAVRSIEVIGSSSPEGDSRSNERLAVARAEAVAGWIVDNLDVPSEKIHISSVGSDYGLLRDAVAGSDVSYRDEVLDIIDNIPLWIFDDGGRIVGGRKHSLMNLRGGDAWRDMSVRFFPGIRKSAVLIIRTVKSESSEEQADIPEEPEKITEEPDTQAVAPAVVATEQPAEAIEEVPAPEESNKELPATDSSTEYSDKSVLAIKTNLLEDALLIPNVGLEVHLGKGWSIGASWKYAWWNSDRINWYWRTYGGDITIRKYFGRNSAMLRGHHLGIYGQIYTYDFELGGDGIIGGQPGGNISDRFNYGGGLEYGYSFRIAERLNLDLSLGFGYSGGQFHEYVPVDGCYVWQAIKNRHYIGPTKAEVSLIWLLGKKKSDNKKGGVR